MEQSVEEVTLEELEPRLQFMTFVLGDEEYGVEILRVQEIKTSPPITAIPNTPPQVRGVMNLRGAVVPVLDMRLRFGMPEADRGRHTVVIVVNYGAKIVGLMVDSVTDVLEVTRDAIEVTPDMGAAVDTVCLRGIARTGERMTLLMDVDRLLRGPESGLE